MPLSSRRKLAAAMCFFLISASAFSAPPRAKGKKNTMTLPEAVNFVRPSVVQLTLTLDQFPEPTRAAVGGRFFLSRALGTGFFVSDEGYVITAMHVLKAYQNIPLNLNVNGQVLPIGRKRLSTGVPVPSMKHAGASLESRGSFGLIDFDVIEQDPRHDLVLLKLGRNPFKAENGPGIVVGGQAMKYDVRAAILSAGRPRDGESVGVSGYPLDNTVLVTTSGTMASSWAYNFVDVQVPGAPPWFRRPEVDDSYLADVRLNPGNSGGPVYSVENGAIIGVCVAYDLSPVIYGDGNGEPATAQNRPLEYNSGLSVLVPITYVIEMLKKHDIKWVELFPLATR